MRRLVGLGCEAYMGSVMEYFEDDDYPWEDMFGEYGSESDMSMDNDGADYESS